MAAASCEALSFSLASARVWSCSSAVSSATMEMTRDCTWVRSLPAESRRPCSRADSPRSAVSFAAALSSRSRCSDCCARARSTCSASAARRAATEPAELRASSSVATSAAMAASATSATPVCSCCCATTCAARSPSSTSARSANPSWLRSSSARARALMLDSVASLSSRSWEASRLRPSRSLASRTWCSTAAFS